MDDEAELDPLLALFVETSKIHDQFIADNKLLDQAIRSGKVSEWVRLARSRLIGDFEGKPDEEDG